MPKLAVQPSAPHRPYVPWQVKERIKADAGDMQAAAKLARASMRKSLKALYRSSRQGTVK